MKTNPNWILAGVALLVIAPALPGQSDIVTTTTDDDGQVTTVIRQIDSEGPGTVDELFDAISPALPITLVS